MTSVDAIIRARGGYDALADWPITVIVPGFMPLSVEAIGTGPRVGTLVAVHHSREQDGDLLFDPEVVFELIGEAWHPLSFEQSGLVYWEAVFVEEGTGRLMCRPRLQRDLQRFCRVWDRNIRDQGFVAAAGG
jgi:hypothetical protein